MAEQQLADLRAMLRDTRADRDERRQQASQAMRLAGGPWLQSCPWLRPERVTSLAFSSVRQLL